MTDWSPSGSEAVSRETAALQHMLGAVTRIMMLHQEQYIFSEVPELEEGHVDGSAMEQ